ncbi:MAG: sigma-70 family RNA polymerase sigma factor [Elusimicrobia bacterium]|nr:sigma-70 family RNA polymerase sigma factor [Elusimicrobiota bacterium]
MSVPAGEAALIAASKRGDSKAFDQLIRRYEDKIFRLAHSVCAGMPSEAEDVYQETFIKAFEKLKTFKGRSNLGTWLYRIASNLCWQRFRGRKRMPMVPILDLPPDDDNGNLPAVQIKDWTPTPEEAARKKELRETVARAMADLPVDYRLVLTLRDIQELSNEEAAKILKLSVPAVKSRLHRGRMFLRDKLNSYFAEELRK